MINNFYKVIVFIFLTCKLDNVVCKIQNLPDGISGEWYQEFTF